MDGTLDGSGPGGDAGPRPLVGPLPRSGPGAEVPRGRAPRWRPSGRRHAARAAHHQRPGRRHDAGWRFLLRAEQQGLHQLLCHGPWLLRRRRCRAGLRAIPGHEEPRLHAGLGALRCSGVGLRWQEHADGCGGGDCGNGLRGLASHELHLGSAGPAAWGAWRAQAGIGGLRGAPPPERLRGRCPGLPCPHLSLPLVQPQRPCT
mmetsp:Transcript_99380/g.252430  ORF Transcript_99380/g.252430 Transcript_99380/m.252430 type:complete len:203 (-) Transcript_99380:185-793(-)